MKWRKLGRIFNIDNSNKTDCFKSHASVPIADFLGKNKYKIYFSSRDSINRSSTGYYVMDICNPFKIIECCEKPLIEPGNIGEFDDSGAMASCILNYNNKKYMYYIGWNLGVTVPFRNSVGLAISEDEGKTFSKFSNGPIIDRNYLEPHFCASSCVIRDKEIFKIWYLSCIKWEKIQGMYKHYYHIKYAESDDGINWKRDGVVAIDFRDKYEYAISVPRVIKENGIYKMWFSSRASKGAETYRIRYAESEDGISWIRKDEEVGIDVSNNGWDSEMICYPYIFDHKGIRYMLYNGNGYGNTGIGLAVLEDD